MKAAIRSTYLGQNSFGARATVTKTVLTVVELNYGTDDETPLSQDIEYPNSTSRFGPEGVALQIDCTPQKAPRVKSNLAAVAVFVMEAPYFSQGRDVSTPTLSRPRSLDERISQVYGRIDEIWLFNTANGKIYG
ncbi:MAG: hypothetical protein JST11_15565 [Acidobacteria bacterium]|nr:hypothetical protein [Acidobacteriota bacterium]